MAWVAPALNLGSTVLGGIMGGKGAKNQQQQLQLPRSNVSFSQLTPNAAALPGYGWLAGNMQQLMQQPTPFFPGQTYVGPSALTQQGVEQQKNMLGQAGANYGFLSNAADVANNPYVQAQMQQNAQSANDMLSRGIAGINQGAQAVNAMGSGRQGLMQGQAAAEAQKNLLAQNAQTQLAAYNSGLNAQQSALGQTGAMLGNMLQPGQTVEEYQRRALQDQMNRFQHMYQEPLQRMQNVQGWLGALAPIGTQQGGGAGVSSQMNPNYQSPMQGILGGMGVGAGFGQAIGGFLGGSPYGNGGRSAGFFTPETMPQGVYGPPAPAGYRTLF